MPRSHIDRGMVFITHEIKNTIIGWQGAFKMGIIEKMRLDGKKGFVTSAARGIGKCTARAFAEAGADVAIVDMDIETAEETAREIAEATGRKVIPIWCDVTSEAEVQDMVDVVIERLGGLDFVMQTQISPLTPQRS